MGINTADMAADMVAPADRVADTATMPDMAGAIAIVRLDSWG
jgi:hypothetical protein